MKIRNAFRPRKRGVFISFEGTEGAGKSSVISILAKKLRAHTPVCVTREPGGTPAAEKIRSCVIRNSVQPMTELFLMQASRAEHVHEKIRPELTAGHWVLCDRFSDSSLAYQGHARGLGWDQVSRLNSLATGGLRPDLSIFLDVDPKIGLARAQVTTRFENEGLRFQKKVRAGFLKAIREDRSRWFIVRVQNKSPHEIAELIWNEWVRRYG